MFSLSLKVNSKYYEQVSGELTEIECDFTFPDSWSIVRLGSICSLIDGEKTNGAFPCLDARFLRGKSTATIMQSGKFVHEGDNIILVDVYPSLFAAFTRSVKVDAGARRQDGGRPRLRLTESNDDKRAAQTLG